MFSSQIEVDISHSQHEDLRYHAEIALEIIKQNRYVARYYGDNPDIMFDDGANDYSPDELFESAEPETGVIQLYHGGKGLESDYNEIKVHNKGRWEYGPGLYLAQSRSVAERYAKGGRRLYRVTIDLSGAREIQDVVLPLHIAIDFVNRNCVARLRKTVIADLKEVYDRRGEVYADTLSNLVLNHEALPSSKTGILRQFLIDHGVDYTHSRGYGGTGTAIYVVVNPRIIQKVERMSDLTERVENGVHLVYHATDWGVEILAQNLIKAKTIMPINGERTRGVSVTRSKRFAMQFANLVFGIDYTKLRQRFKISPVADNTIGVSDEPGDGRREAEDFVITRVGIPIDQYVVGFWIIEEMRNDPQYEHLARHPLFRGWYPIV